jgi:phytoene synthase
MTEKVEYKTIFKKASKTHYFAAIFFPEKERKQVETLYGFLRVVDDLVDEIPPKRQEYYAFKETFADYSIKTSEELQSNTYPTSHKKIIADFILLQRQCGFTPEWINAFFASMEMDLNGREYDLQQDTLEYVYGVAEVVGLMVSRILGLTPQAYEAAQNLGRAAQYINIIRDIHEDNQRGRVYLPSADIKESGLSDLSKESVLAQQNSFRKLVETELAVFDSSMHNARTGFRFIPRRYRIPVKTIADIYQWTARQIRHDPFIIYEKKVKPSKYRVILYALKNII